MVSAWWLVAAFIAGGYAGILVTALMYFVSERDHGPRSSSRIDENDEAAARAASSST
jgi:RsiW-degrading membrane proteinase PrsW (M82 family)